MTTPSEALVTGCVPGCDARVQWGYEEPEYRYPNEPDIPGYFYPVSGCCDEHYDQMDAHKDYEGTLNALMYTHVQFQDGAQIMSYNSRKYLGWVPLWRRRGRFEPTF